MRLVCISDTHTMHRDIGRPPDGDVLVHAGDWCGRGTVFEMIEFLDWMAEQPHVHKVLIAGNHDWIAMQPGLIATQAEVRGLTYLCDAAVVIDGAKFYGSPWQPAFCDWAFNLPRGAALREKWAAIPTDTDVLITHGPAAGILDRVTDENRPGCHDLRARIKALSPEKGGALRAHVCGHIHEDYGRHERWGVQFVNAATCDGRYRPVNKPIVVEL